VAFVADVDRSQVSTLARSYGTRAVVIEDPSSLPDCDIALLATPVGVRERYIGEFERRDIPVLAEKPFAPDPETHQSFLNRLETVSCNYLRLCFSPTRQARTLVTSGLLGQVRQVECSEGNIVGATGRSQDDYQTDPSLSESGVLLERGSHIMSQLLYVLTPSGISIEQAELITDDGYDVDVTAQLITDIGNQSVPVQFDLSRIRPVSNQFRVVFENGSATFNIDTPNSPVELETNNELVGNLALDERWATTFAQSAYLRWRQFLSKISSDNEYPETIATGPGVTQLIADLYDTAEVESL
jgi:predicted dehydrogenase